MKKIITLIVVLLLVAGCSSSKPKTEENNIVSDTATTNNSNSSDNNVVVETQPALDVDINAQKEKFKNTVDEMAKGDFEEYASYYDENGAFNVDVVFAGLVDELILAMEGDQQNIDGWKKLVEASVSSTNELVEAAKTFNIENPVIIFNILNDANKDNVLLSIRNGVVEYDALRDSQ